MQQGINVDAYLARTVRPRRPYIDTEPEGYLESDLDYMRNNADLAVALLDAVSVRFPDPTRKPR